MNRIGDKIRRGIAITLLSIALLIGVLIGMLVTEEQLDTGLGKVGPIVLLVSAGAMFALGMWITPKKPN